MKRNHVQCLARYLLVLVCALSLLPAPTHARDACPDAPPPRLQVGGTAVVVDGADRLNMRALPAVGTAIVQVLYSGNELLVLDGPSCNGGYNWWRVEYAETRRGWVAEGDWETYYVVPDRAPARVAELFGQACYGFDLLPLHCIEP